MIQGITYISKQWSFDAAHQLYREDWSQSKNWDVFGHCANIHGHTYNLEVTITGPVDSETGMVLNYHLLGSIVKPIVDRLDHCKGGLNEVFDFLTTAENMVGRIAELVNYELTSRYVGIFLAQVTLQETPKTKAVWKS